MRKFFVLLKKEIRELFTLQMLIPMLAGLVIFMLMGTVMGDVLSNHEDGAQAEIFVLDLDDSNLSRESITILSENGFTVNINKTGDVSEVIEKAKNIKADAVIVIHKNFEENILIGTPQSIDCYSILKSMSVMGQSKEFVLQGAISSINEYISNKLILEISADVNPVNIKYPVFQNNFVEINGKTANVSSSEITSFLTTQNVFIPVVMFMIIIYSAQLLITTLAAEKENKTMETLLSAPLSRTSIISSKMVAAGISAFIFALVYMVGFQYYMGSIMGDSSQISASLKDAIEMLGLTMGVGDYILLGLSLFASILVTLALASILGSLAEDVKKAQGYITPIMLLTMVPYLLTMLVDMNSTQPIVKIIVNAIPFAHPFQASSFLFMNQYLPVILGILYQFAMFAVLLFISTKIYSSDKIFLTKHSSIKFKKRKI